MNSPADEAEARDRAHAAPRQADPDAPCRGETGTSSGSEARPVTATGIPCSCGKGTIVLLPGGLMCCSSTLAKYEAIYGAAFPTVGGP